MIIGFTVGVFDIFHHGHANFLRRCRQYCDYLVIGVMTDYWVKVQKGHERPFDSIDKRLEVCKEFGEKVIALDTLDMTPYLQVADKWIKSEGQMNMRPESSPIPVIVLPRTAGISSTQIIQRLRCV